MHTVYAVSQGQSYQYEVLAIFPTREAAEVYATRRNEAEPNAYTGPYVVEEFPFYDSGDEPVAVTTWFVMWKDEDTEPGEPSTTTEFYAPDSVPEPELARTDRSEPERQHNVPWAKHGWVSATASTRDEALRLVREARGALAL